MLLENKNAAVYGAGGSLPSWRAAAGDSAGRFEGAVRLGRLVLRFRALGPECLRMVAIHAASRMETTWLEEDRCLSKLAPSGRHR